MSLWSAPRLLKLTDQCLRGHTRGQVVREAKVASEPEALIGFLCRQDLEIALVGLEAGPLSQWLHAGLPPEVGLRLGDWGRIVENSNSLSKPFFSNLTWVTEPMGERESPLRLTFGEAPRIFSGAFCFLEPSGLAWVIA